MPVGQRGQLGDCGAPRQEEAMNNPVLVPAHSSWLQEPEGRLAPTGEHTGPGRHRWGRVAAAGGGETGETGGGDSAGDTAGGTLFYGPRRWGQALSSHLLKVMASHTVQVMVPLVQASIHFSHRQQ